MTDLDKIYDRSIMDNTVNIVDGISWFRWKCSFSNGKGEAIEVHEVLVGKHGVENYCTYMKIGDIWMMYARL